LFVFLKLISMVRATRIGLLECSCFVAGFDGGAGRGAVVYFRLAFGNVVTLVVIVVGQDLPVQCWLARIKVL
jgi:hypothetical protein